MLNVSAYLPSNENYDEVPSPLVDGTDALPPVEPLVETLEPVVEAEPLPLQEFAVELPPELDPTPLQPLEGDIVQAEVLAENAAAEAGQLMGAQIALEGYAKLLRSADKNMTRQSAAFMAVGMARANRLMGVQSIGLEDENSGTQVMAMQKANVDQKGLGSKIAEAAKKIWEWLKQKGQELIAFLKKSFSRKKEMQAQATYLIAASEAVASGNPKKVEGIEAPSGIKVAQVLDAIHGENVRAPKSQTITIPEALATYVTKGGKLDLSMTVEHEVRSKVMVEYFKDVTALLNDITQKFKSINNETSVEQISDELSDMVRKHLGGKAGKWEIHGMFIERTPDGKLVLEKNDQQGAVEVQLPSPQEIGKYMKDVKAVLDSDVADTEPVIKAYEQAVEAMMTAGDSANLTPERSDEIGSAIGKVLQGNNFEDHIMNIGIWLDRISGASIKAADFFLSHHLGKGNTVSQEDYVRMPSRGLSVIPQASGPGVVQRGMAIAREMWAKLKDYFAKKWEQFSAWAKNLWASLFGTAKDTDVLLLTNGAVPDEGDTSVVGTLPALPQGTRLKSVQATRMLEGPSAGPAAMAEPEVVPTSSPAAPAVPQGFVLVPEASELMTSGDIAIDPVWEEAMTNWLLRHYIPTQEKIVKDVISFAGSAPLDDQGMMQWQEVVDRQLPQLFQGMPVDNVPGLRAIQPGTGCKIQVRQEGMMPQAEPIRAVKKRQLDQALSRQKKLLGALAGIEKTRVVTERQRAQLNAILDRRVTQGMSEQAVTQFYNYVAESVIVSSANVIAAVIGKTCAARNAVADAMIVARAKRK